MQLSCGRALGPSAVPLIPGSKAKDKVGERNVRTWRSELHGVETWRSEECEDYDSYFNLSLSGDEWQGRIYAACSSGQSGDIAETITSDGPGRFKYFCPWSLG